MIYDSEALGERQLSPASCSCRRGSVASALRDDAVIQLHETFSGGKTEMSSMA